MTLAAVAVGDALTSRSIASVRNVLFLLIAGTSCVVMTGLPEVFFPALPDRLMMVLKAGLGPLAGAMGLYYLSNWLGGVREDSLVHRFTVMGGAVLLLAALALAAVATRVAPANFRDLLALAAAPDTAHFYNNLGYAYYLQGRPVEAAAALQKAASLKPGDAKITTNLNLALAQKNRAELEQQAFAPATATASPPASSASNVTAPPVAQPVTETTVAAPALAPASPPVAVEPTAPVPSPSQPVIQPLVAEPAPVIAPPQLAPAEPQQTVEPAAPTMLAAAPPSARAALYEVSNGNGITGMARRVNQALLAQGYPAARLTNSKPFRQPVTVVEYRPGYAAVAAQLSASLPLKPAITEKAGLRQSTDVRLVLGRDVMTRLALVTPRQHETQLALGAPPRLPKP